MCIHYIIPEVLVWVRSFIGWPKVLTINSVENTESRIDLFLHRLRISSFHNYSSISFTVSLSPLATSCPPAPARKLLRVLQRFLQLWRFEDSGLSCWLWLYLSSSTTRRRSFSRSRTRSACGRMWSTTATSSPATSWCSTMKFSGAPITPASSSWWVNVSLSSLCTSSYHAC